MPIVNVPTEKIVDWPSFHAVFSEVMGFPSFYGNNMNAWIDCMTSCDSPDDGMSKIHCVTPDVITLHFEDIKSLADKCPDIYDALLESSAFVNYRRLEMGDAPVLALSFHR
jgi:hypothetical protein